MPVYKACFKIIQKNLTVISIYVGIFLFISFMCAYFYYDQTSPGFMEKKSDIALINEDQNTALVQGLSDFLEQNTNIINIANDPESLQDALFFRKVDYIVRIPAGFSQSLKSGQNSIQIEKTSVDQSLSSVYLDFLINRYLSTARLYIQNVPDLTDADLLGYIKQDMARQTRVEVKNYGQPDDNKAAVYYTYLVYAMIAIMFLGVTSIMLVFNDTDLKRRNLGSPLKAFNMNLQLFLGNLSFALMVWMIMLFIGLIILRVPAFSINSMLLYINLLCLTLACLSLSFLIGNLISSRYAQQAIVNVLSLGLCFISGVFVPQQLLGHTINLAASFTPTYWYVKAVNDIDKLVDINAANIAPIINSMLIQLGFVVAFLTVTLAIAKQKRVSA